MFKFIQDKLLVNHGLVLISGVESPIISYLLSAEAIRALKKTWDMRFVHIIYRYLRHEKIYPRMTNQNANSDEPTHLRAFSSV